jgi:hypothetical protein
MLDLAQVIADAREEAQVLRANGAGMAPDRLHQLLDDVTEAAEEYLTWLTENDASIRSGYSLVWLRSRFPAMQREGHARLNGKARQYRACAVPRRANTAMAAVKGREAARKSA